MAKRFHIALTAIALLGAVAATAATASAACPNEAIRKEQGMTHLPECMALEMVSPPAKGSQAAINPSFSAGGQRVRFKSNALLGNSTSLVNPLGDVYIAERGSDDWTTMATTAPAQFGFGTAFRDFPRAFTPDFARWIAIESTASQYLAGRQTAYEGTLSGAWTARSPLLEPLDDPLGIDFEADSQVNLTGASADLSHLFFQPARRLQNHYIAGDPEPVSQADFANGNTYVFGTGPDGQPSIELLGRDGGGVVWGGNCGTWVGGGGSDSQPGGRNQGAIAAGGTRVIFSTRPEQDWDQDTHSGPPCEVAKPIRILIRDEAPTGPQITELLPSAPAGGSDFFEGASLDQSRIFFTSSRALAGTDGDATAEECEPYSAGAGNEGCDLYLYEELPGGAHQIVQVSAGGTGDPSPGEGADVVRGVTAISGDGSHVYFVGRGVLTTTPNPSGDVAADGALNLYAYARDDDHPTGHTAFVGALSPACASGGGTNVQDCRGLVGSSVSYYNNSMAVPMLGSGHTLVFISAAALSGDDADGDRLDVYRYRADSTPPSLTCVSCRPGGPDAEPFDVDGRVGGGYPAPEFAQLQRWASEGGDAVVFGTAEPLLPDDEDGAVNPFVWLNGTLTRLPGAKRSGSILAYRPVVANDGSQFAFQSSRRLVPQDRDTAEDVYVARAGGGFPPPAPEPDPCSGSAECRGPLSQAPATVPPASAAFAGRGNANARALKRKRHAQKRKRVRRKARNAHRRKQRQARRRAARRGQRSTARARQAHNRRGGRR